MEKLGKSVDIVLCDGELSDYNGLAVNALEDGEIVIQVTNQTESVKAAYSLIKRAHQRYGRREYGLLVTGVNEIEAHRVYDAMATAAGNYLRRASRAKRSVVEAFPATGAAMAFSRLARHMTGFDEFAFSN